MEKKMNRHEDVFGIHESSLKSPSYRYYFPTQSFILSSSVSFLNKNNKKRETGKKDIMAAKMLKASPFLFVFLCHSQPALGATFAPFLSLSLCPPIFRTSCSVHFEAVIYDLEMIDSRSEYPIAPFFDSSGETYSPSPSPGILLSLFLPSSICHAIFEH